jgi:hypothetical protein
VFAIGESDVSDLDHQGNLQNFSKVSYVPICIQGVTGNHDALNDSGSQVNLIKRDLLQQLPEIQTTGRVSIKGISWVQQSRPIWHCWISKLHRRKLVERILHPH